MTQLLNLFKTPALRDPRYPIQQDSGLYSLKTLTNNKEFKLALQLRHRVFLEEMQGKSTQSGLEYDHLDRFADHLGIFYGPEQILVGTYRILFSDDIEAFYSESEFHLETIKNLPERKIELGRACIAPEHRNGAVIQLLWRGIALTMEAFQARYLIGCSSVPSLDESAVMALAHNLQLKGYVLANDDILPRDKYLPVNPFALVNSDHASTIPPLLLMYLKAGAKVSRMPAFDKEFGCADFFTILDRESLAISFRQRFFSNDSNRSQVSKNRTSCA